MSKICEKCGCELPDNAVFCGSCGTSLQNKAVSEPDPVMQQEEWQAEQKRMQAEYEQRNAYTIMNNDGNGSYVEYQQHAPGAMPYGTTERVAKTKREFMHFPQCNKPRKGINEVAVACYIFAGINWAVYQFNLLKSPLSANVWLDIAFLVGMGLGLQLSKHIVFAILLTAYGAINMGINVYMGNYFGGWMILLAGIFALRFTIKLNKEWKEYKLQNHIL